MPQSPQGFIAPSPLVAVAGWLVPGAGYVLIGQKLRGIVIGITIIALFMMGLLIAGIRVIDVPGYDDQGRRMFVRLEENRDQQARERQVREVRSPDPQPGASSSNWRPISEWQWTLWAHPFAEIANKPWFVGQILAGPICLVAAHFSLDVAEPANPGSINSRVAKTHSRIAEIGTLYTAVAGMLNLLAIIDSSYRAGQTQRQSA